MIELKNVLVATDFSEAAAAALLYGRALASRFGATLHVLHVAHNLLLTTSGTEAYMNAAMLGDLQAKIERAARQRVEELLLDTEGESPRVKTVVITAERPAEAIVQYARERSIDLIVTGTQGRGFVSRLMMGSVAERVVRTAPCPVLAVHHPEHDFVRTGAATNA